MSSASSTSWSDCLNNPFCPGERGISPIVIHIVLLFITIFLAHILRSDRFFVSLLILWNINLWVFTFTTSVWFWYLLVAFDLWAMNKFLNTKKTIDSENEIIDTDDENQGFLIPGALADAGKSRPIDNSEDDDDEESELNDTDIENRNRRQSVIPNNNPY